MKSTNKKDHCCFIMTHLLEEGKVAIGYAPRCREYYIHLATSGGVQIMDFCPWCGCRLPLSLRDLYFDEIRKQGFEDPLDDNLPEKYKTDEWWKERKL
jgi:hypothetical protein